MGEKEIDPGADSASLGATATSSSSMEVASRGAIWAIIGALTLSQFFYSMQRFNGLTEIVDPYSEANAVRAAEGYVDNGFFCNAGLPDTCYGTRFSSEGHLGISNENDPSIRYQHQAYTHYPPGCEWLAAVYTMIFGKGRLSLYRLFPVAFSMLAMVFLARTLIRRIGAPGTALIFAACAAAPMFSKMMHHLHFLSYTMALMMAEFAVLVHLNHASGREGRKWWLWLGTIGFLHGWFSFDYCFLVVFSPVVFGLIDWGHGKPNWRAILGQVFVVGAAFTFAHAIHFAQVVAYYGSLQSALDDFRASASYRASGTGEVRSPLLALAEIYFFVLFSPSNLFYEIFFGPMLAIALLVWLAIGLVPRSASAPFVKRSGPAVLVAIVACATWPVVMRGHALEHWHVLPRHWFLLYFTLVVSVVLELKRLLAIRTEATLPG